MKAYPLLTLVLLLLSACDFDIFPDPEPPPPPVLPPITQTGENTLGFLLDGEVWVPNRIFQAQYRKGDGAFLVSCERVLFDENGNNAGQGISIFIRPLISVGEYHLTILPGSRGTFTYLDKNCRYITFEDAPGSLIITQFDTINRIVSGKFSFGAISEDNCSDTIRECSANCV